MNTPVVLRGKGALAQMNTGSYEQDDDFAWPSVEEQPQITPVRQLTVVTATAASSPFKAPEIIPYHGSRNDELFHEGKWASFDLTELSPLGKAIWVEPSPGRKGDVKKQHVGTTKYRSDEAFLEHYDERDPIKSFSGRKGSHYLESDNYEVENPAADEYYQDFRIVPVFEY